MNRKTWKTVGIFALLGLALSWVVSSCSPSPSRSPQAGSGTAEVEFWTMQLQPQFTDYFNQLIAQFEQSNPGTKVRWVDVPWADMQSKILTAVSANTAPDVVNLNPDFAAQLAGRNAWLELDDRLTDTDKQQYLPKIWQANTLNGKSFGIPWYLSTSIAIYNQQIMKQAGINKPPATYVELAEAAKQIKEKTGKYAFFATFVPEDSGEVLQSFVQMGAQLVDDQGKAAFNTPEGKAVFQYWTDLYKQDLLPKEALTQGHRRGIELYQSGQTALLSTGPQFLKTIATNAPAVAEVSAAAPQITGATGKKSVAVMNLVIPRKTDQPDAALKFALFVANDQNQLAFAKAANVLPSTVAALKDSYFTQVPSSAPAIDQARAISAKQMQDAEVLLPNQKEIKVLQKIIYDNLQAAMLGEKSIDQAVSDAAGEWDQR
ncbi:sugar ABC transporter substrate-binding protein [Leptolyngbya sp. FACHB-711]|uniref:ABC transporter substrate-binding protein n=1 Tax=unclassified Leptolyngbya TaxID=2650499 RepID=UPI0016892AE7|nr:sugar ABC transporter substrate-binding protein [Leptolyngbya sp. FACHB-711]MBD1849263.1 sugar ABC transporter substrate-binding protein [Cyanobacteria bacterium FACHB-502]MBD2026815.1 sugar ABC transporter substrate-binding protein [Leptolyngbya sp. FACHB-711]